MQRVFAAVLAIIALTFGVTTAFGAPGRAVAIVTASPASEAAARYLSTQIDLPTVRRDSENARRLDLLTAEARTHFPEDLVVVLDAERASVSVLRPSDGTIGSRALGEQAARAPYAVALAAVELLEIVRNAPPAHAPVEPAPARTLLVRISTDIGIIQSIGTTGSVGLLEPTVGVDVGFARPGSHVWLLGGVRAAGLVPTSHDLTLVLPTGDSRGRIEYGRDDLSLRFGVAHRQGPSAVFGWADLGVAFIHVHSQDSATGEYTTTDRRSAIWLGFGAELRYTVVGGLALGIGAGVAFLPVASRFYSSPPGSPTELVALREDPVDLRARASVIWEFEP